jgi:hypothetical protein
VQGEIWRLGGQEGGIAGSSRWYAACSWLGMSTSLCIGSDNSDEGPSLTASSAIALALGGFVVLIGMAMIAYPGGTSWDTATRGHDFWLNYLCDLERQTALNGESNLVGARLAQVAMFLLGMAAAPFWWSMPRLFAGGRGLSIAVRSLGTASICGMVGVVFFPSDRFGGLHPFLMALAGAPGLTAAGCSIVGLARRERIAAMIGGAALLVAAADFAFYAVQLSGTGAGPMAVAVLERVALMLILAWMGVVAWGLRR